jgi:hypothetical protein
MPALLPLRATVASFHRIRTHSTFGQKILNIAVTEIESVVEPNGVADDVRRESVTLVGIHPPILAILGH